MKLNFSKLTKEQKQVVFLVGMVGCGALYAMVNFGILPMIAGWKESRAKLGELTTKLAEADRLVGSSHEMREELSRLEKELKESVAQFVPDGENTLAWVTRRVYQKGRDLGLDIEAVTPSTSGLQLANLDRTSNKLDRFFDFYSVRVTTSCSYVEALQFVDALEQENPYLVVSGLVVSTVNGSPERHSVQVDLQWPIWAGPEGPTQIRALEGERHG